MRRFALLSVLALLSCGPTSTTDSVREGISRCGTCAEGYSCIDDPGDACDLDEGADCPGMCATSTGVACGGFAGLECPDGQTCVDNPRDNCDPSKGGADCIGLCMTR